MKKRLIRSMAVIFFTGILCIFSITADPLPAETADNEDLLAAEAPDNEDLLAAETADNADLLAAEVPDNTDLLAAETAGTADLLAAEAPDNAENAMQVRFSSAEQETCCFGGEDNLAQTEVSLSEMPPSETAPLLEIRLDKDALLSIVNELPGDPELICSDPDFLASPQAKKTRNIIRRFQEDEKQLAFIVLDLNTGSYLSLNPDFSFYSASTIKGPYVAALNKFSPEMIDEDTEFMMENTIRWSSNEDYENLHHLYGNDVMYEMTEYTEVSESIIDEYDWYPYLTAKELTRLWIGIYDYFFEDTNDNSEWCRSLYTESTESFIHSAVSQEYTVYTKPGWYSDWEDISRNDAGIVMADGHDYILTIMSDAFDSYDELEELAAVLDEAHGLLCSSEKAG